MTEKLLSNSGWDYAVLQMKNRPPILIERTFAQVTKEDDFIVLTMENGPHPVLEKERALGIHYIPFSDVTGVSYYNNKLISTNPSKIVPLK